MAKKKTDLTIPFNEKGMRTFQDVRSAITYFRENGKIPQRRIVALFQSTFQIVSGKYSVNVIPLAKLSVSDKKLFLMKIFKTTKIESFERIQMGLERELQKWNSKFSDRAVDSAVSTPEKVTVTV